ncbi:glutamate receptor ionotropic, delta-1 isoform X2 [Cherax quadricarinatus]|uniref:glutamate receptor ionotropic, delta-1 isoform X2 n=1 Tax=Cherax quadricarinatus TaxID=27406 RepID=UPI00387E4260
MTQTFLLYDVETFLKSSPPQVPLLRHPPTHSDGTYCVAYYILAPVTFLALALPTIPKTTNCPFCRRGEPEIILRNRWSPGRGFQNHSDLFPDLYQDCNGHIFKAVALDFPPFIQYSSGNSTHPLVMKDCLDKRIIDTIAEVHNFTYQVFEPADGLFGYQLDNGSFTGVLGEIQSSKRDFSLDLSITAERGEVVDFTIGYHWEPLTFVTSKPQPLPQWLALVRPFQAYMWLCLLLMLAASGPTFWLLQWLSGGSYSLPNAIFLTFGSMISQVKLCTGQLWPRTSEVRVFSVFWLLFCLVVAVSYVGNLTAFLTVPALSPTIDSLEDLLDSNFVWGINNFGAADYQLFKTSKVPLYQNIFRGLTFCPSLVECMQRALNEHFAFISFKTYLRDAIAMHFIDKNGETRVYLAKDSFFPADTGYAVQKGSPIKRVFDGILKRLLGGGFVAKWMSTLIDQHTLDTQSRAAAAAAVCGEASTMLEGNHLSLTLYHLQGVFVVYAVGLLFSLVIFICELILSGVSRSRWQTD